MATIYVTITDEEDGSVDINIDAAESGPEDPRNWSPAEVLGSHLHDYIVCLDQGVCAEQSRKHLCH